MIQTSNGYIYRAVDFAADRWMPSPRKARLHRIVNEQGHRCALCLEPFAEGDHVNLDHIVPVSAGGSHGRDNLQATHVSCNSARGAAPLVDEHTIVRVRTEVVVRPCPGCAALRSRVEFLERAQRVLRADWESMRESVAEVARAVGGVPAGKKLPDVLRERLARKEQSR